MPFFFGPSSRPLYGVLDPAAGGGRSGVLVCQPTGPEYFRAHRPCRLLARRLSEAGVHAMRFDPSGTGNSGGELEDVTAKDWASDVELAIDELRSVTGAQAVVVVGVRAGCSAGITAGLADPLVEGLVLWDPLSLDEEPIDVPPGLPTPSDAFEEAGVEEPRDVFLVRTGAGGRQDLDDEILALGHELEVVSLDEAGAWEAGSGIGSVPIPVGSIEAIVRWVGERT